MPIPGEPIVFMKATTSICGPNDNVMLPQRLEEGRLGSRARLRDRQAKRRA